MWRVIHLEYLACIVGIISDFQIRSIVLLISDPGLSVLIAFIHREGRVVIQVNSGQRLVTEMMMMLFKCVHMNICWEARWLWCNFAESRLTTGFFCLAFLNFLIASEVSASSSSPEHKIIYIYKNTETYERKEGQRVCVTLTSGCVTLPEGKSFSQSSAHTVNLCLTGQKHQDTTWTTETRHWFVLFLLQIK